MTACACCFATGLVWLHPSRADWPPSSSYRGRIGFTCVTARVFAIPSPPAPLLRLTLVRLHAEQAIYMVNSFQFTRSARLILAYPTSGRRTMLPSRIPSDCSGASWVSSMGSGCCRLGAELSITVSSDVVPSPCRSHPNSAICFKSIKLLLSSPPGVRDDFAVVRTPPR